MIIIRRLPKIIYQPVKLIRLPPTKIEYPLSFRNNTVLTGLSFSNTSINKYDTHILTEYELYLQLKVKYY